MYQENTDPWCITPQKKTGSDNPLNKTAIRKYGVFADGPALPFRDTGFLAEKGVSLQGKASVFAKPARDTDFWTENGVSRHGKTAQSAKTRSRLVNWAG
jgi:hypothetical protein